MLDVFHIPSSTKADIQIFNRPCTAENLQWETWRKPRGASMINIFCIGGGAGGGGGFTRAASSAGGGGGSGGSSPVTRVLIPACFIPDVLAIQVGAGGQGVGSGGGVAGSGIVSVVSIQPSTATLFQDFIAQSGGAPTGGGSGTGAAVGAAGAGGSIGSPNINIFFGLGNFNTVGGQAGVAGGAIAGANGTAITIPTTNVVTMGGSGGAGTTSADFAGGLFTAVAGAWLSEQRPATPAAGSFNGSGGIQLWKPFFSFGGGGGSSSNAGAGGNGGNGAYGSGGGGGGAGTTGGRGGNGGSGLVIIISW
jgi:hypothetical protein